MHDLRSPLGVIAYFAQAVPASASGERDELCQRLAINAHRALHVLETFALLSSLRRGRAEPGHDQPDWAAVAGEVVEAVEAFERRPGSIHNQVDGSVPLRMAHLHFACVLRELACEILHQSAPDERLSLVLSGGRGQPAVLRLTLSSAHDVAVRGSVNEDGTAVELARRVAALYGGSLTIERGSGGNSVALQLPCGDAAGGPFNA